MFLNWYVLLYARVSHAELYFQHIEMAISQSISPSVIVSKVIFNVHISNLFLYTFGMRTVLIGRIINVRAPAYRTYYTMRIQSVLTSSSPIPTILCRVHNGNVHEIHLQVSKRYAHYIFCYFWILNLNEICASFMRMHRN